MDLNRRQLFKATRKQVADYAGVSEATVSCVLNDTRAMSEKTKQKVFAAVKALGYVPDIAARAMKLNKSYQLAMIVDDITEPMFAELAAKLEKIAMQNGYFVNICGGYGSFDGYIAQLVARKVDGIFLAVNLEKVTREAIDRLISGGVRIVMGGWDREYYGDEVNFLNEDVSDGFDKLLRHLQDLGHTEVAYLSAFAEDDGNDRRVRLFREKHLEIFGKSAEVYSEGKFVPINVVNAITMTQKLIEKKNNITAIACTNDIMALGAVKALRMQGLRCPEDVSVAGIDNNLLSRLSEPTITTFGADYEQFARIIFDELTDVKRGGGMSSTVPVTFYPRESTGRRRED